MEWELADLRLEKRAKLCVDRIQRNPDLSFPDIFSAPGELLGFYRFINNKSLNNEMLFGAYLEATKQRCHGKDDILVLHDTTVIKPSRKSVEGLSPVYRSVSSQGFLSHLSLAVASDGPRVILGPCGLYNWTRGRSKKPKSEHLRWFEQVQASEGCFSRNQAIHVMDREGDSYTNLSCLQREGYRFVIRSCHDRQLSTGDKISEFIANVPIVAERIATVGTKKASPYPTIYPSPSKIANGQLENIGCNHRTSKLKLWKKNQCPAENSVCQRR